jgi:hypothetical protein
MDPFEGVIENPTTKHPFLYTGNNPVNSIDPTGRFTLAEVSATTAIQGILNSIRAARLYFTIKKVHESVNTFENAIFFAAVGTIIPLQARFGHAIGFPYEVKTPGDKKVFRLIDWSSDARPKYEVYSKFGDQLFHVEITPQEPPYIKVLNDTSITLRAGAGTIDLANLSGGFKHTWELYKAPIKLKFGERLDVTLSLTGTVNASLTTNTFATDAVLQVSAKLRKIGFEIGPYDLIDIGRAF